MKVEKIEFKFQNVKLMVIAPSSDITTGRRQGYTVESKYSDSI